MQIAQEKAKRGVPGEVIVQQAICGWAPSDTGSKDPDFTGVVGKSVAFKGVARDDYSLSVPAVFSRHLGGENKAYPAMKAWLDGLPAGEKRLLKEILVMRDADATRHDPLAAGAVIDFILDHGGESDWDATSLVPFGVEYAFRLAPVDVYAEIGDVVRIPQEETPFYREGILRAVRRSGAVVEADGRLLRRTFRQLAVAECYRVRRESADARRAEALKERSQVTA